MIEVSAKLIGVSPLQQSAPVFDTKLDKETHALYEERTWIERGHWTRDGKMFIPAMAAKYALSWAVKYLSISIPGQGKKNYTQKFESGLIVSEDLILDGVTRDNVRKLSLFVPSDGKRGGTSRVWKHFPVADEWSTTLVCLISDEIIERKIFEKALDAAGKFNGLGSFRPQLGGTYGRFRYQDLTWNPIGLD